MCISHGPDESISGARNAKHLLSGLLHYLVVSFIRTECNMGWTSSSPCRSSRGDFVGLHQIASKAQSFSHGASSAAAVPWTAADAIIGAHIMCNVSRQESVRLHATDRAEVELT
jgi:hypothetical protein